MGKLWAKRRLEIVTLSVFILLVMASLSIFYTSYINYSELHVLNSHRAFADKVIMFISAFILFLSLFIMVLKRDHFFMEMHENREGLENLLGEIKSSSNTQKMNQFKEVLKEKSHTEIYGLILNMIKELQERTKQANEANEAKTLFLSNISHELRTPINGILGFSKILSSTKLDEEQKDFVETISKSSEELLSVVNNILDIAQMQSGKIDVEKSYFNVFDVFESLAPLYAIEASNKEIEFLLWIDPALSWVLVESDSEKIKQILMNLISNALKFTQEKGQVVVSITKEHSKKGEVSIRFEVTDTGIGISDEQQREVFSAFTQGDNSSTRKFSGVGLGLTLAHSWVKLLGGELKLESIEGRGTTVSFTLMLPAKELPQNEIVKGVRVGLYAPLELQTKKSHDHLKGYLSNIRGVSLESFEDVVACKNAKLDLFDVLYLHYEEVDKEELQRIVAQYGSELSLILITKLENRFNIQDISPVFSQIIYHPTTFSKMKNSLNVAFQNREALPPSGSIKNIFNLKALVVEDNSVNQKIIIHTLKNLGIRCDTAENGKEAVEMFKKSHYDIVFMDIQMPVMNGMVATKEIIKYEKLNKLAHTPIVAVTTNSLKGDRESCLEVGMDEYIAKPINTHKFISVIKQFYSTEFETTTGSSKKRAILLYRETPTEAKIMANMLIDLGYGVEIAKNRVEFLDLFNEKKYDALILDRTINDSFESKLMDKIHKKKIETLLFIDEDSEIYASDLSEHIHLLYQSSDFILVEEEIEMMVNGSS